MRGCDGELAGWHPVELAGVVGLAALNRAGMSSAELDEVVVGCAEPVGANGADVARAVVLAAGWPADIGGHVIDRGETSGAAALQMAAASIVAGARRERAGDRAGIEFCGTTRGNRSQSSLRRSLGRDERSRPGGTTRRRCGQPGGTTRRTASRSPG